MLVDLHEPLSDKELHHDAYVQVGAYGQNGHCFPKGTFQGKYLNQFLCYKTKNCIQIWQNLHIK